MTINSFSFLAFFALVFFLYFIAAKKHQPLVLLVSSFVFVASFKLECLLLLCIIGTFSWMLGILIEKKPKEGKKIVGIAVTVMIAALFYFKYLNFSIGLFSKVQKYLLHMDVIVNENFFKIILPAGISFYIFSCISYLVDVYKGKIAAEKSWLYYMLFLSYFPKFTLGPIERAGNLLPQLRINHEFDYDLAVNGCIILLIGLFKKIAVADAIAVIVNNVYGNCRNFSGLALVVATILYAFQIYCDFSGYTDMAIGISKILGINLAENFRNPYLSQSITEFWRRWHISLSSWFRDYVYIPMGGNRVCLPRYLFNSLFTMTLSGVWHGASINYIIWGFLNGALLCAEKLLHRKDKRDEHKKKSIGLQFFSGITTFIMICITWVFFRADSFSDAIYIFTGAFQNWHWSLSYFVNTAWAMGLNKIYFLLIVISLLILAGIEAIQYKKPICEFIRSKNTIVKWGLCILVTFFILMVKIYAAESQQFIYFEF